MSFNLYQLGSAVLRAYILVISETEVSFYLCGFPQVQSSHKISDGVW